jgi:hypothetical protein
VKLRRLKVAAALAFAAAMLIGSVGPALAQDEGRPKTMTLWVDPSTGQLFTRPGKGRKPFVIPAASLDTSEIEHHVEQRVEQKTQESLEQTQQQMKAELAKTQAQTQEVSAEMAAIKPAWTDYIENFKNKFRVGTLVYADWRMYTHTGFGPQELTQINAPGPGNNLYNTFDISRAYLNFFFNPTEDWTVRVTPNVYRVTDSPGTVSGDKVGKTSVYPQVETGNMGFRLKYAYLQYSKAFDRIDPMKGDTITVGQEPNPLVAWEEDLYGFRYVNLTPWNYLSLSSTQQGISVQGPIKFNGLQYIDYDAGVYNNASFHAFEQTNTKQFMGRASIYPFGAAWRFDGLGLTGFYDYGYSNVAPDTSSVAKQAHVQRFAGLVHYATDMWGLAGEFDYGKNAFTTGNLWSSSGPVDAFGGGPTSFSNYSIMTTAFQNNGKAFQEGFDFFGHLRIPQTPFTILGMFEEFLPNTKVDVNPNDFQRWVAGLQYQYNEFLRFTLASQNLLYYHSQFNVPASEVKKFGGSLPAGVTSVKDAVPRDNHMIFLGLEFSY